MTSCSCGDFNLWSNTRLVCLTYDCLPPVSEGLQSISWKSLELLLVYLISPEIWNINVPFPKVQVNQRGGGSCCSSSSPWPSQEQKLFKPPPPHLHPKAEVSPSPWTHHQICLICGSAALNILSWNSDECRRNRVAVLRLQQPAADGREAPPPRWRRG